MNQALVRSLVDLSRATQESYRAAVDAGDTSLAAELKHLAFQVAHCLAKAARSSPMPERAS